MILLFCPNSLREVFDVGTLSKGGVHEIRLVTLRDASGSVRIIEVRDNEVPNHRVKFVPHWR